MDVGNLMFGSSPFSKSSLDIWNFSVHILLKPLLHPRGSYKKGHLVNSDVLKFTEGILKTLSFLDFGVSLVLQLQSERLYRSHKLSFFHISYPEMVCWFLFQPRERGKSESSDWFSFLGSNITPDNDWGHDIKRHLLLGKKAMTNLDTILKKQSRHFANKGPYSQSYGFSRSHAWMWELDNKEGWVLKNWCFQTVVLEKTLESPWTARRSNQSILNEINPEYSLEVLMLKLKLQYFGHLMQRTDSLEKTLKLERLKAGEEGDDRG